MVRSGKRNTIATATSASLLSLLILEAVQPGAHAQTFNGFSRGEQYDFQGLNPSVAVNSGTIVEVHNGTGSAGPLWYRVGKLNGSTVTWSESEQYDSGFNPSVALAGTAVVEVHNAGTASGPLWYRVGKVNGSTITWNESHQYDNNGFNPTVAVAGTVVVEVHNGGNGVGPLWYRMGKLNDSTITWSDSHKFDSFSTNPTVAAFPCTTLVGNPVNVESCGVDILEVHNDNAAPGPLWYRHGHSNDGSTISWQNALTYDSGWNPKIAWAGSFLLEVHNGGAGSGPLWYHTGAFLGPNDNPAITFDPSKQFDTGNNPSVAIDPAGCPAAIEVHNGGAGLGPEWYNVGTYTCSIIQ
jgi:hypothetical protein